MGEAMRLRVGMALYLFGWSSCGGTTSLSADASVTQCKTDGRTCESANGVYVLENTGPAGCKLQADSPSGYPPRIVTLRSFDAGVGEAQWSDRSSPAEMTRLGCRYVSLYSTSAQDIEFTYDPACDTLTGRVQINANQKCGDAGVQWFDVVGRKP